MLELLRQCAEMVGPRWRLLWMSLIPLGALIAALEMVGTALVFVLIRLLTDPSAIDSIRWLAPLRAAAGIDDSSVLATWIALLLAAFFSLKSAVRLFDVYVRNRCDRGSAADLSTHMLRAYLSAPYEFHLQRNSADLLQRAIEGTFQTCSIALYALTLSVTELLVVAGILVMLLWITPGIMLVVAFTAVAFSGAMIAATHQRVNRWGTTRHAMAVTRLSIAQQSLQGVKEVMVLGRAGQFSQRFSEAAHALAANDVKVGTFQWVPRLAIEVVFVFGLAGMIAIVNAGGAESWLLTPMLGLFAFAGLRLLPSFQIIVYQLNAARYAAPSVAKLYADFRALAAVDSAAPSRDSPWRLDRELRCESVSFRYRDAPSPAIRNLSFAVRKGESVGIVGATGAGKSTVIDILLGLLPPESGRILCDDHDIASDLAGWRRQLGYVPQSIFLLDESIRANIAFGVPPAEIDESRVRDVVAMAQLTSLIDTLPNGLDTITGERGVRLSGGERQRVAIARALYRDPAVLIFDEATSALDNATERLITDTIEGLRGEKTMIVVAHRLTTVRHCDRLVLLHAGQLAASGTYDELLRTSAEFRSLAEAHSSDISPAA